MTGSMAGLSSGEKETPACRFPRFVPGACSANVYLHFTSSRPQHRELALFHRAADVLLDNLSPCFLACRDLLASQEPSAHHNKSPLATSSAILDKDGYLPSCQNTASTACVMPRHNAAVSVLHKGLQGI